MTCFQSESSSSGKDFEDLVIKDLVSKGYTIVSTNVRLDGVGIEVDYIAEKDNITEYGEAKGGKEGGKKVPGARRTDNVKKALCNGALLKFKFPERKFVVYFSAPPKKGSASEIMLFTASEAGYIDEVRYLSYDNKTPGNNG
jgi:hypothetical protein